MLNEISKTVYSLKLPQTQDIFNHIENNKIFNLFDKTYEKKQDLLDIEFKNNYLNWVKKGLIFNDNNYPFFYFTAGSSEAIREQIIYLNTLNKKLIIFEGEYEGYEAIANAIKMPVIKIKRHNDLNLIKTDLQNIINSNNKDNNYILFLSNPSSIDGCFYSDFYNLMDYCDFLNLKVYLDITYLGNAWQTFPLDIYDFNCIEGIFFSFSKIFGTYYNRIGGVFLKQENPLLYGNKWFKNLYSMYYGNKLMQNISFGQYFALLKQQQQIVCTDLSVKYKIHFIPSDVFLLSTVVLNEINYPWQKDFIRNKNSSLLRICITPALYKKLYEK